MSRISFIFTFFAFVEEATKMIIIQKNKKDNGEDIYSRQTDGTYPKEMVLNMKEDKEKRDRLNSW